jgi:MFS family permease
MGFEAILGVAIVVVLSLDFAINVGFNPTRSIIADVTPDGNDRTKGYTWMQTVSGSFAILAYAIGAFANNYVLIYIAAVLVLVFSILPPLFIEEPETIELAQDAGATGKTSFAGILLAIQPLWGFLVYDLYAITLRILGIEHQHYYAELVCGALTIVLIARSLFDRSPGRFTAFRKVLAAHSFSWVAVQTMFVYMFVYLLDVLPTLDETTLGQIQNKGWLVITIVSAILPAFVLEPITERIGRIKTHVGCLAAMAAGYASLYFLGSDTTTFYVLMILVGVGWASIISLPFAIMSEQVEKTEMGLYMGLFNLSVVLPQLVASLGVGLALSRADNPNIMFVICAVAVAVSALAWTRVGDE